MVSSQNTLLLDSECIEICLNPSPKSLEPFFRARSTTKDAVALAARIEALADLRDREWYYLTWTTPNLKRLRLVHLDRTPQFERSAHANYLRSEIFRVTGQAGGCNINFSGETGAALLAARLRSAIASAEAFIEIVVIIVSRKKKSYLVEFHSDLELRLIDTPEHDRLAEASEVLAGESWTAEEFQDWERSDG